MQYWILLLLCLAAVIAYVQRIAISLPAGDIQRDLGFGTGEMGSVMAAFYLGYAVLQVPSGWLADRWGSRRALVLYAAAWSTLTLLTGLATGLGMLMLLWGMMGLAQAGIFPASAKAIGDWFADTQRAFASGLLAASQAGGAVLAPLLTTWLLGMFTWRHIFFLYALPGLCWAGVFLLLTPEKTRGGPARTRGPVAWERLLTSVPMGLLCLQQFLRGCAMAFFYTWFPTYVQEVRHVSRAEAGAYTAWIGAGAFVGGVLGGLVSDALLRLTRNRRISRQGVAVVGMTACATLAAATYFVTDTNTAMLLLTLGAFWGTFGGVSGYSVAIEFGGRHVGIVFSVMNMCGNVGAFAFPLVVGHIVPHTGWDFVLFLFAGCFAADAVCWALLNPRGTLFEEPDATDPHAAEPVSSRAGPD